MKSIIRILKKRRSGGFTLVEMVVSVALLAILLGGMMVIISPIIRSYNDNAKDYTAENTANCVEEYISRTLRSAQSVSIFTNTNVASLSSNAEYSAEIKRMSDLVVSNNNKNNNNGSLGGPRTQLYTLRCMSLKFRDGKYALYDEYVSTDLNGAIDTTKEAKVFSDCLYKDLYLLCDFAKPKNGDYGKVTGAKEFRDDALDITISVYRDSAYSGLVYYGTGITEMRAIKGKILAGNQTSNYKLSIYPETPLKFADTTDGSRDIFIYYISRGYGV